MNRPAAVCQCNVVWRRPRSSVRPAPVAELVSTSQQAPVTAPVRRGCAGVCESTQVGPGCETWPDRVMDSGQSRVSDQ